MSADTLPFPLPVQIQKVTAQVQGLEASRPDFDALLKGIFSALRTGVSFQSGWFATMDASAGQAESKITPWFYEVWRGSGPLPRMRRIHLGQNVLLPTVRHILQKGGAACRGCDFWVDATLTIHPFYHAVLRPASLYYSLFCVPQDDAKKCWGYLVLWRRKDDGDFSNNELCLLGSLGTVIADALRKNAETSRSPSPNMAEVSQEELQMLVRRRTPPGALILDEAGRTLYLNGRAKKVMQSFAVDSVPQGGGAHDALPDAIRILYDQLKAFIHGTRGVGEEAVTEVNRLCIHQGVVYLFRALRLCPQDERVTSMNTLILMERVSHRARVDHVFRVTNLTRREQDVVRLLLEGKTNKEVGHAMGVGEYTVKAHIRGIMTKLQVGTRAGIVAKVLQSSVSAPAPTP